jgi:hypothetical protein
MARIQTVSNTLKHACYTGFRVFTTVAVSDTMLTCLPLAFVVLHLSTLHHDRTTDT